MPLGALGAAALVSLATSASASITFDDWSSTGAQAVNPVVTVDDDTAGKLTFNIAIPFANALISGVWIDLTGNPSYASSDITVLTPSFTIAEYTQDAKTLGGQNNLNGGFSGGSFSGQAPDFDIGFRFEDGAAPPEQVPLPVSFTLDTISGTFGLGSIELVGLRFQSVGTAGTDGIGGGGSEKLVSLPRTPTPIPLPAGIWLMLAAIGALGAARLRTRSA